MQRWSRNQAIDVNVNTYVLLCPRWLHNNLDQHWMVFVYMSVYPPTRTLHDPCWTQNNYCQCTESTASSNVHFPHTALYKMSKRFLIKTHLNYLYNGLLSIMTVIMLQFIISNAQTTINLFLPDIYFATIHSPFQDGYAKCPMSLCAEMKVNKIASLCLESF